MDLLLKLSELYPWSPIERFGAKRYSKRMNGPFHSYLSNSPCPSKNWINSNMDVWFKENVKSCFVHGFRDHPFLVDQRSDSKPLYYSTVFCFFCTRAIIFITTTVLSFYLWLLHRIDLELGNERRESEDSFKYVILWGVWGGTLVCFTETLYSRKNKGIPSCVWGIYNTDPKAFFVWTSLRGLTS